MIETSIIKFLSFELDLILWHNMRFIDSIWFYKVYFFEQLFDLRVFNFVYFLLLLWKNFFVCFGWRFSTLYRSTRYLSVNFLLHSWMKLMIIVFPLLVFMFVILIRSSYITQIKEALKLWDDDFSLRHMDFLFLFFALFTKALNNSLLTFNLNFHLL